MTLSHLLRWIVFLPLLGCVLSGGLALLLPKHPHAKRWVFGFILGTSVLSFALSCIAFGQLLSLPVNKRLLVDTWGTWFRVGSFSFTMSWHLDQLSALLCLVVTGVGVLVQWFGLSGRADDQDAPRFFVALQLALFGAVQLFLSGQLLFACVGWQSIALASYVLSSYWSFRHQDGFENARAGTRMFLVQRLGDLSLLLGILALLVPFFQRTGTTPIDPLLFVTLQDHTQLLQSHIIFGISALNVACFCFVIAIATKALLAPFHWWLTQTTHAPPMAQAILQPLVMAGAGIYLVARCNFLFSRAPEPTLLLLIAGGLTAILAGLAACCQHDIKQTVASLCAAHVGLVFFAMGTGDYSSGILHFLSLSCFQVLLMLGTSAVLQATQQERDMRKMGGLFIAMRLTGFTMALALLASIGFPGFSGFFSINNLLWAVWQSGHRMAWGIGIVVVSLLAFGTARLFCLVFMGSLRMTREDLEYMGRPPEERGLSATIPMMFLSVLSVFVGFFGISPQFAKVLHLHRPSQIQQWLFPVFQQGWTSHPQGNILLQVDSASTAAYWPALGVSMTTMIISTSLAFVLYAMYPLYSLQKETRWAEGQGGWLGSFFRLLQHHFYLREFFQKTCFQPTYRLSKDGIWPFEQVVLDGTQRVGSRWLQQLGIFLGWVQGSSMRLHFYGMIVGTTLLSIWFLFVVFVF
jgi:NADH-quinone oxidoreductase subunit L